MNVENRKEKILFVDLPSTSYALYNITIGNSLNSYDLTNVRHTFNTSYAKHRPLLIKFTRVSAIKCLVAATTAINSNHNM